MLTVWARPGRRLRDAHGIVALEFALTAPFLITLILGLYDLTHGIQTWRRLSIAAESVAQIASEEAAQANGTNILTPMQVWQASTAAFAIFPTWKSTNETHNYGVTLTSAIYSVSPANCTLNCTYTPKTVWSIPFDPGLTNPRPCGTLTQVANGQANALNQVPVGLAGPSPLMIADNRRGRRAERRTAHGGRHRRRAYQPRRRNDRRLLRRE